MDNQKNMEKYEVLIKWYRLQGAHNITYVLENYTTLINKRCITVDDYKQK